MKLSHALSKYSLIVENGPLGTRLKYDYGFNETHNLSEDTNGRKILSELYKGDIVIAIVRDIPIVINALTFFANHNHLTNHGAKDFKRIRQINLKAEMRALLPIFLGAPIGSMFESMYFSSWNKSISKRKSDREEL